jgi:hypothetical protein
MEDKVLIKGQTMAEIIYRIIEKIDGEKGKALIPYKVGQMIKVILLVYFIK